jgi:hypothetical protein
MTSVANVVMTPSIANEPTNMPISQYITNIRDKYNPNLDLSFMDFFMGMYDTSSLVSAELLAKYGVLSIKPGRITLQSSTIKRMINKCHLVENVDYSFRPQLGSKSRGAPKDHYMLTPKAFKICLISSENENKYRDYFLFLEECIHYYNSGQTLALKQENTILKSTIVEKETTIVEKETTIIEKDDVITLLRRDMQNMMARMDTEREERNIQHVESTKQMSAMQSTLNKIVKKLDDREIPPSDSELTERFVLMKKDDIFYVIRSQERRIQKAIKERERLGFTKVADLLDSELILDCAYAQSLPNSIYLWNCIREVLVKENKISTRYNEFQLVSISEFDLIEMIKGVFNSRNDIKELN